MALKLVETVHRNVDGGYAWALNNGILAYDEICIQYRDGSVYFVYEHRGIPGKQREYSRHWLHIPKQHLLLVRHTMNTLNDGYVCYKEEWYEIR